MNSDITVAEPLPPEPLRPAGRSRSLGTIVAVREIFAHRELLDLLVRREVKARYKDSVMGMVWTLVRPLVMLAVYYFAIGKFLGASRSIPEFAVYIFAGLTAWGLFNELVQVGTSSVVANAGLVKKVYLPREIFPLSAAGSALFNFGVQLVILIGAMLVFGVTAPSDMAWFPLSLAVLVTFGLGLAFILSAVNVYLRDIQYLVEVALMVAFWASPVIYSWTMVRENTSHLLTEIYLSNPVTLAVLGFQRAFWSAGSDTPLPDHFALRLWTALGVSLVLLWLGQRLFTRIQGNFAQEL